MILRLVYLNLIAISVAGSRNVLLIIVDDLRPSLGCYGDAKAHTPNMDKLARRSVIFTKTFAQQSLCAPSRNSLLTSRRPDTLQLYDVHSYWRNTVGNFTTLPQYLKTNGYSTMSVGKVFHPGASSNGSDDSPYSWSEKPFHPFTERYKNAPVCRSSSNSVPAKNLVCPVSVSEMPNGTLPDIETLEVAKRFIEEHSRDKSPFFLAVGFQKPHIPFKYPKKYLKYHSLDKFRVPDDYQWPDNVSSVAYNPWTDLRRREDIKALGLTFPYQRIPPDYARKIMQSYYAAITFVDDLIGMLLNQLSLSGLRDETTILLTSDHGWSLGEHAEWAKYSNFDVALRVPLIVSIPGVTFALESNEAPRSTPDFSTVNYVESDSLIELVDIFPTVANIVGLEVRTCDPSVPVNLCSEGSSFLGLVEAAMSRKTISWKTGVFSQYPRPGITPSRHPNSDQPRARDITIMGYTIRTHKYRYTAWIPFQIRGAKANWTRTIAEELYDHRTCDDESFNLSNDEEFKLVKKRLRRRLKNGWTSALPRIRI